MKYTKRAMSLLLALVLVLALAAPAMAASGKFAVGVGTTACKGNLSDYSFPAEISTASTGQKLYINAAATTDIKLKSIEAKVSVNGGSYTSVGKETAKNYIRWSSFPYTPNSTGTYKFLIRLTRTDGSVREVTSTVTVKASASASNTSSGKISFSWSSSKSYERTASSSVKLNINGTSISNGTTFYTYDKNGNKSTGYGGVYRYAKVNGKLLDVGAGQCFAYARYCQQLLYGCNEFSNASKFKNVVGAFTANATTAKNNITKAGVGAHIRTSSGHSIFVIKVDSDGFYFTDANSDWNNTIKVAHCTWSGFASSSYGSVAYIKAYQG